MSRVGRLPITIPAGVQVDVSENHVVVKGPRGTLERDISPQLSILREDGMLRVERPTEEAPGRLYLGVCGMGQRIKSVATRVYTTVLAASQVLYERYGAAADPWMTTIGYFNSLLGQLTYQITPLLSVTAYDILTQGDEPNQADRLGLRRDRGRFTSNVFSLSADYRLGGVATRAYYLLSTFFDEAGDDTYTSQYGASATTSLGANVLSAGYEYLDTNTTESFFRTDDVFDQVEGRGVEPRVRFSLTYQFGSLTDRPQQPQDQPPPLSGPQ